jgi:hypothetical protein
VSRQKGVSPGTGGRIDVGTISIHKQAINGDRIGPFTVNMHVLVTRRTLKYISE